VQAVQFKEYVLEVSQKYPELKGLASCGNLDRAFRFLSSIGFVLGQMELVSQDEFTLDVLMPFSGSDKYLILGVT
jgi:hypothetical protein